jgi:hypothetical protein
MISSSTLALNLNQRSETSRWIYLPTCTTSSAARREHSALFRVVPSWTLPSTSGSAMFGSIPMPPPAGGLIFCFFLKSTKLRPKPCADRGDKNVSPDALDVAVGGRFKRLLPSFFGVGDHPCPIGVLVGPKLPIHWAISLLACRLRA